MKHFSLMIKPASALCNMRCRYCFYADVSSLREVRSFGMMQPEVAEGIIARVYETLEDGDAVSFAFQGGEPTLAGLAYFEHFVAAVAQQTKKITVHYALQTNGLLLDDAWCAFLAKHNFLVGVSMDGAAAMHDENRIDAEGKGTFSRVMAAKNRLEKFGVEYNILWVLTNHHARYPQKVWNFLRAQNIKYVQFIPCLAELNATAPSAYALTPQRFASFYTQLFTLWVQAFDKGEYISVKFFDDVFNLLMKHSVTACGFTGQCQAQYVVEADGSVYPCDFYVLDEWRMGFLHETTPDVLAETDTVQRFLQRPRTDSALCQSCRYHNFCGGGCPRMKNSVYLAQEENFCGYRTFLDDCAAEIERVIQRHFS